MNHSIFLKTEFKVDIYIYITMEYGIKIKHLRPTMLFIKKKRNETKYKLDVVGTGEIMTPEI